MKRFLLWFFPGLVIGALIILGGGKALHLTSTNDYCVSCHIHPMADASWKKSVHYETQSGYRVACVECHLPPKGKGYLLSLIHISEPTRLLSISYAVFCLKKKKKTQLATKSP